MLINTLWLLYGYLGLLTILILFTLFMFSSTAFASDTKDYKFKTYKQGKLEITSNLPDEIDPTIVGKITDKNGNEKEAEGKVKHTPVALHKRNVKITILKFA